MTECQEILGYLVDKCGYNTAGMERVLELPQGSLSEIIKGREALPEERALLRMIGKHTWIMEAFNDITWMLQKGTLKQEDLP